jgi:predicted metal-dependent hydrolase
MSALQYINGYTDEVQDQVRDLLARGALGSYLFTKYPTCHGIQTDKALGQYVNDIKRSALRKAPPINKICYDNKLHVVKHALGTHTFVSRIQGNRLKAKHEIRVASVLKQGPLEFLRMITVHELAHLKEKEHNKAFYKLCTHIEPDYHQLEFDMRLYLTYLDIEGALYGQNGSESPNSKES